MTITPGEQPVTQRDDEAAGRPVPAGRVVLTYTGTGPIVLPGTYNPALAQAAGDVLEPGDPVEVDEQWAQALLDRGDFRAGGALPPLPTVPEPRPGVTTVVGGEGSGTEQQEI